MSAFQVTKTMMRDGEWHGVISGAGAEALDIAVTHDNKSVPGLECEWDGLACQWTLLIPIPLSAVSDGVQTLVIHDAKTDETLGQIALMAGDVLGDDMRAEMALMRAELDMLKRAFRRHCAETA